MRIAPLPSETVPTVADVLLSEFSDGDDLDQVLLVRSAELRDKKAGGSFLRLSLGDRSGSLTGMVWDNYDEALELCKPGSPVRVRAKFEVNPKYGPQLKLYDLLEAEAGSYDEADLLDGPPRDAATMEADLRELTATVQDPYLQQLLARIIGPDAPTWERYRDAPAAKYFHQAYAHGLLEHSLTVAQAVSANSAIFPGVNRDIAVTGALLHDIGKLQAYGEVDGIIDLTDAGRLQGEIPLGYALVRDQISEIADFPPELGSAIEHIVLSHHGSLEHGSPVVPATREATLVHMMDNLGGRLGSFDRIEKELAPGAEWSSFDRAIGGGAYFGPRSSDEPRRAAA
jgi:3'-5' exoribonuclease